MKIIITGSLGNISKPLVNKLVKKGHSVTVISSKAERQKDIEAAGATAAIGTMEDGDFLSATFKGADVVYIMEAVGSSNFFDQNGMISRPLGLKVYPETFVIAPDRTLVRRMTGLHEWDSPEMIRMLRSLSPSKLSDNVGVPHVSR